MSISVRLPNVQKCLIMIVSDISFEYHIVIPVQSSSRIYIYFWLNDQPDLRRISAASHAGIPIDEYDSVADTSIESQRLLSIESSFQKDSSPLLKDQPDLCR